MKIENPSGSTPLEDEVLLGMIPNLTTQGELNEYESKNIAEAKLWTKTNHKFQRNFLSVLSLIELHKQMFNQVWEWSGKFRWTQTNIGVTKENIQNELGQTIGDVKYWLKNNTYNFEEIAIRLHYKLVWIHPFPNGNGRWARLAADIFLESNGQKSFNWASLDLSQTGPDREHYLSALRLADETGSIVELLSFAKGEV